MRDQRGQAAQAVIAVRALGTLTVALVALALAPAAHAQAIIERAAMALRSDPVYVDPRAEEHVDADRVRREIERRDPGPMYVADLPDAAVREAGGEADGVVVALHNALGRQGTYAVIVGNHFRAGSEGVLERGVAGELATEAFDAHRADGPTAVLVDFVDRVDEARANGGHAPDGGPGGGGAALIALLALGGGAFALWHAVGTRRRNREQLAEVKAAAHDDLIALADDVQGLEAPVDASRDEQAQQAYQRALECYEQANGAYDRARRPQDLERVTTALEEGRYSMAVADSLVHGRKPPDRRPPCFFDPRHGPSARDVEWAPPGGAPRKVPACEADAQAVERGLEPQSRQVLVDGRSVPYWGAPAYFGGWAGGFFSPFSGFLPGLFVGELLGGAFGGFGGPYGAGWSGSGDGGGGGGWSDFGGGGIGDFGGGDFGGGGGGDF